MAIKLLLLSVVAASFVVSFCSSMKIPNLTPGICQVQKILNNIECSECNFLTFGQDKYIDQIGHFCPNFNLSQNYCCYDLTRKPFCCDRKSQVANRILWVIAVIAVIAAIGKFLKWVLGR